MINRSFMGKQLKGRGAPRLTNRPGVIPDKAKRQPTEDGGSTPAHNVQGSGRISGGVSGTKNAMSSSEGACGRASGHVMGRGS